MTSNVICPALTETDMTASMPEAQRRRIVDAIPLGRAGTPNEVAAAVTFLASDDAASAKTLDLRPSRILLAQRDMSQGPFICRLSDLNRQAALLSGPSHY